MFIMVTQNAYEMDFYTAIPPTFYIQAVVPLQRNWGTHIVISYRS